MGSRTMMGCIPMIPHVDTFVEFDDVEKDVPAIVEAVRPEWIGRQLNVVPVPGGNLNRNCRVSPAQPNVDDSSAFFLHVINPVAADLIPNHLRVSRLLNDNGIGPRLYATFRNGTAIEFLTGTDLESPGKRGSLLEPEMMRKSAHELARFHTKSMLEQAKERRVEENFTFFKMDIVNMYWKMVPSNDKMPEDLRRQLPTTEEVVGEFSAVASMVEALNCDIALCHGDYNPANMMVTDGGEFIVIDFDGCTISYSPFDMAYFFIFAFNNHFEPGERIIPPTDEYYSAWCRCYLESKAALDAEGSPTDTDVRRLVFQVKKAMLTICVRLTVTSGLLSAMGPAAKPDQMLNFLKFSVNCWREYLATKDSVRAMTFSP